MTIYPSFGVVGDFWSSIQLVSKTWELVVPAWLGCRILGLLSCKLSLLNTFNTKLSLVRRGQIRWKDVKPRPFRWDCTSAVSDPWCGRVWWQHHPVLASVFYFRRLFEGVEPTMPISFAFLTCSSRALAVTAITGTGLVKLPSLCITLILRTQVRPSITCQIVRRNVLAGMLLRSTYRHLQVHEHNTQWNGRRSTVFRKSGFLQECERIDAMIGYMYYAWSFA